MLRLRDDNEYCRAPVHIISSAIFRGYRREDAGASVSPANLHRTSDIPNKKGAEIIRALLAEIDAALRLRHRRGQVFRDLVEEARGGQPTLIGTDQ
jgi:hypothetical protein